MLPLHFFIIVTIDRQWSAVKSNYIHPYIDFISPKPSIEVKIPLMNESI